MAPNAMRFVRVLVYKLKRAYGFPIDLYRVASTLDSKTGKKTVVKTKYSISRAIVLPSDLARKYQYDHSYIVADKQFTYGAMYDAKIRTILIDKADLPKDFEIRLEDYAVYDNERYEFKVVTEVEHRQATLVVMRSVKGQQPGQVIELPVYHNLRLVQTLVKQ